MKSKFTTILLSFAIALGLWMYVITSVSPGSEETYYNIPVVLDAESVLAERNLMITHASTANVTLKLSGNRTDLYKVNSQNITLKSDLSKIYEEGTHSVGYTIAYPGDVPNNAFDVIYQSPKYLYITVERRVTKPVPVEVKWIGSTPDGFMSDRENRVLDYDSVTVVGPASVADLIEKAVIEVDLNDQKLSISQDYRYTLCDKDGNPVDAEKITTNVEDIHLDVKIQQVKEVRLVADVIYGGGATEKNTTISIEPAVIRLSGGSAVLEELGDTINLGKIDLSTIEKSQELTLPISLPEGITNLSNIREANVDIRFSGLMVKTFEVENIEAINVPDGFDAEIIEKKLVVILRGPAADITRITEEDITIRADLTGAVAGTSTFKATVHFSEDFSAVGAVRSYSVTANVSEQ